MCNNVWKIYIWLLFYKQCIGFSFVVIFIQMLASLWPAMFEVSNASIQNGVVQLRSVRVYYKLAVYPALSGIGKAVKY